MVLMPATFGHRLRGAIRDLGGSLRREVASSVKIRLSGLAVFIAFCVAPGAVGEAGAQIDLSFGEGGVAVVEVVDDASMANEPAPLATQADGKIIVATKDDGNFAVFRLDTNGTLDTGFGESGKVVVAPGGDIEPVDLVVQSDDKIVVLGSSVPNGADEILLVRLEPDGALDLSFGTDGVVEQYVGGSSLAHAMALQADGKIVVVGQGSSLLFGGAFLARFHGSGVIDDSFGQGGVFATSAGLSGDALYAVALQPDGKIVAAGLALLGGDYGSWLLVRLLPDGTTDDTFGGDGYVQLGFPPESAPLTVIAQALALAIQPDGKIVAAGSTGAIYLDWPSDFASARFDTSGALDPSYGAGGVSLLAPMGGGFAITYPTAIMPTLDGRFTMVGHGAVDASYPERSALAVRVGSDGSLDPSWGENGVVEIPAVGLWTEEGLTVDGTDGSAGTVLVSTRSAGNVELRRVTGRNDCGNGVIDPGEFCDDANAIDGDCCSSTCQIEDAAQLCRPSLGVCDPPEFCNGVSATCPADQNVADGTPCSDGRVCTQGDSCLAGLCEPGTCDAGRSCGACGRYGQCTPLPDGRCSCRF